jgi:hypothetical protein
VSRSHPPEPDHRDAQHPPVLAANRAGA